MNFYGYQNREMADDILSDVSMPISRPLQETIRTQQATIERLTEQRDKLSSEANRLNEYYLDNLFETRCTSSPDPNQDAEYLRVKALIAEIEASNE